MEALALYNKDALASLWHIFREDFGDWCSHPVFPVILGISTYLLSTIPYLIIDFWFPSAFAKYKLQPNFTVTWRESVYPAVKYTIRNNILWILPVSIIQVMFAPYLPLPEKAPTVWELFRDVWLCLVLFDIEYGLVHWLMHSWRWLYRVVHSKHHEYRATHSMVTQYLHPAELLAIGLMSQLTPIILGCHPLTSWVWEVLSVVISVEAHSGYDFPFSFQNWIPFFGGSRHHDLHHVRPKSNYFPLLTWADKLFGTYYDGKDLDSNNFKHYEWSLGTRGPPEINKSA